jgi:hypothetical protein
MMDSMVPDLSKAWLADKDGVQADAIRKIADEDAGRVAAALEALASLVTAARSIV